MFKKFLFVFLLLFSIQVVQAGISVRTDVMLCNPYTMERDFASELEHYGYEGGLEFLNICLKKYPDSPQLYNKRGNIYKNLGLYKDAISDYDKAISIDDSYLPPYHGKITVAMLQGDFRTQLDEINKLILKEPNNFVLIYTRAVIYMKNNNYQEALSDLNKVISINKSYKEAFKLRGLANSALKKYKNCTSDLDVYIKYKANDADSYFHRAYCSSHIQGKSHQMLHDLILAGELYKMYGDEDKYLQIKQMLDSARVRY